MSDNQGYRWKILDLRYETFRLENDIDAKLEMAKKTCIKMANIMQNSWILTIF